MLTGPGSVPYEVVVGPDWVEYPGSLYAVLGSYGLLPSVWWRGV